MSRERSGLVGRGAALAALSAAAERGGTIVVRGEQGSGKTALLRAARRIWLSNGVVVITAATTAEVLAAVRDQLPELADHRLVAAVAAVDRWCSAPAGEEAVIADLARLFACLRRNRRLVLMVDDLHRHAQPLPAMIAARRAGAVVVASRTGSARLPQLDAAEHCIDLEALTTTEVDALIADAAGMPVDVAVSTALRAALGPLAGNPGTVVATVRELRDEGRLVELGGVGHLRARTAPIALPEKHFLVARVQALGQLAGELVVMVATSPGFGVDDLAGFAAAAARGLPECGRVVDQLVAAGALAADPTGRLTCPCPALPAALRSLVEDEAVRTLHRVFAEHLLCADHRQGIDPAVIADHVVSAGTTLPRRPEIVALMAVDEWISDLRPERIARRYHAAVLHAEPGHPATGRILSSLLRLLVRLGWFDRLGEVVADVAPTCADANRAELAFAAALAALHVGHPVPARLRELLAGTVDGDRALDLCDRWFAADSGIRAEDVATAFHGAIPATCAPFDLVAMFQARFGAGYRAPSTGPLPAYHRVMTAYAAGRWDEVLSAAVDLDLTAGPDTPARHAARLVVVEINVQRGRREQAWAWFVRVPVDGGLAAVRGWAEMGLLADDHERAFSAGVKAYELACANGEDVAVRPLLVRLLVTAAEGGRADRTRWLLTEIERLHRSRGHIPSWTSLRSLARGLVERDEDAVMAALDTVRACGRQVDLLEACLAAASVVADPKPLLCEAYQVATVLRAEALRTVVRAHMKRFRLAPPRSRELAGMSGTEARIVELIRAGKTNRQIAAGLGVSEKTVERHLTRLFVKTGCRSRIELATADQGLPIGA